MLSFYKSDKPIAKIIDPEGDNNNKIIYLHREVDPEKMIDADIFEIMSSDFFREKGDKYSLKITDIEKIYRALTNGHEIHDNGSKLEQWYNKAKQHYDEKRIREFKLIDGHFEVLPSLQRNQRDFLYICGPSGVGKSTFGSIYIKNYHKTFPSNPIYIFSQKEEDPAFDKYKFIARVEINDDWLLGEPLQPTDFKNSLCVFDDIENIPNEKVKDQVYKLKDAMLEIGRSMNINVIVTAHLSMNYKSTRKDLNELSAMVLFKNGTQYHIQRYFKQYLGLDKNQSQRILNTKSRWILISTQFPMYVLTENEIFLI